MLSVKIHFQYVLFVSSRYIDQPILPEQHLHRLLVGDVVASQHPRKRCAKSSPILPVVQRHVGVLELLRLHLDILHKIVHRQSLRIVVQNIYQVTVIRLLRLDSARWLADCLLVLVLVLLLLLLQFLVPQRIEVLFRLDEFAFLLLIHCS